MRNITHIVIHCTGARQDQSVDSILRYWKEIKKWKQVGYHRLIESSGKINKLADFEQVTNGVGGHNSNSIHICYIGGEFSDDRTPEQKAAILTCIKEAVEWIENPKDVIIQGHRDFPGVAKSCPQVDCSEYSWITA